MDETFRPLAFALMAAVGFAASQVTARRGLVETSIVSGVLISLTVAFVIIGSSVGMDPPDSVDPKGLWLFALAGIAAPGVSRWAATTGIHRLGPSISAPITQAARPLLAVAGALILLGEQLSAQRGIGLVAIVAGGWELSRSRAEARTMGMGSFEGDVNKGGNGRPVFRAGIVFPLVAGGAYATSDLVVKTALNHLSHPRLGALVGMATALIAWGIGAIFIPGIRRQLKVGRDFGWLILSGALAGLATNSLYSALEAGDITFVSPVLASQPLAVFIFSRLLLRSLERLDASTIMAGSAIVFGTTLISI